MAEFLKQCVKKHAITDSGVDNDDNNSQQETYSGGNEDDVQDSLQQFVARIFQSVQLVQLFDRFFITSLVPAKEFSSSLFSDIQQFISLFISAQSFVLFFVFYFFDLKIL